MLKKYLSIVLFLCWSFIAVSQTHNSATPTAIFIDSVRVGDVYLDPHKIADINIVNSGFEETTKTKGRVYIKSKNPKDLHFLRLENVAALYTKNKSPKLYMIDNKLIKDIENTLIDSSYILKCEVVNTKDLPYLKNASSMIIFNILTRSEDNLKRANEVRIRGTEATSLSLH